MDVNEVMKSYEEQRAEKMQKEALSLKTICKKLHKHGIKKIEVRFCGSGDSGEVEEVKFITATKEYASKDMPELNKAILASIGFEDINKLSDEIGYSAVEFINGDWCNNEGGQGTIYIDTKQAHLTIEVGYNVMTTEDCTEEVTL